MKRWKREEERTNAGEEKRGKRKKEERTDRENERARVPLALRFDGRSEFGYLIRERRSNGRLVDGGGREQV